MTSSRMCAVLGSLALVAGVASCGGEKNLNAEGEKPVQPTGGSAAKPTNDVKVVDFKFQPQAVTVNRGARLTWSNEDSAAHTATADNRAFDTGAIGQSQRKTLTMSKPGSIAYHCEFHPFMKATVEVR